MRAADPAPGTPGERLFGPGENCMNKHSGEVYRLLFRPDSIAVIGASNNKLKPGGRVTGNIKDNGFGGRLWAVNPKDSSVLGLPTFALIEDLPEAPDLALVAIPSRGVVSALEALAVKGTKAAIILTAGFGEKDEAGKQEEKRLLEIASAAGMTIIGPNCSGFMTPAYAGKFAGFIPPVRPGGIDFISGSGATVDYLMEQAVIRGLVFSNVVNLGNSIQTGVEDILGLLDEGFGPDSSRIIMLYMELIRKPQKLLHHARSLAAKGCVIVGIKSGVTAAGARAAASHTGAMAAPDNAVQALFDKAGIIRVRGRTELVDAACALRAAGGPLRGRRVCVFTDAGGPGVMLTDELNRQGLEVPVLGEETRRRLRELLPPEASTANPIDCLPSRTAGQVREIFRILAEEERDNIDVSVFITGNSGMSDPWEIYREVVRAMDNSPVPVIPVLSSTSTCAGHLERFRDEGKVFFTDEVSAGQALGKIFQRPPILEALTEMPGYDRAAAAGALKEQRRILSPERVEDVLSAAGFRLPPQLVVRAEGELAGACGRIGFPLVMKVIGPLHKSDAGGVKIGLAGMGEAGKAWNDLMNLSGAEGVLIQKMIEGTEVILGAVREEGFGSLVMFGLGGIYTEVLKDVRFALAPLALEEARRMIRGIRSFPLLEGLRGQAGVSVDLLAAYLVRLSLLVADFPEIAEIDLNPVKGAGEELYVVDGRILLIEDK